jgi:hypothetical protein
VTLELGGIDPGDKVLHVARYEESRVGDGVGADSDMALLDVGDGLRARRGQVGFRAWERKLKRTILTVSAILSLTSTTASLLLHIAPTVIFPSLFA